MMRTLVASLLIASGRCGMAPSTPPEFPEGWCDPQWGTPTRTTGECMCRSRCEGSGCESAQGFVWYAYAQCPTCKCVAPKPLGEEEPPAEEEPSEEDYEPMEPLGSDDHYEPTFAETVYELIDDYGHAVLAIGFVVVLVIVFVPLIIMQTLQSAAAQPAPPVKDEKKD